MRRSIVIVVLGKRKNSALHFQRILTQWGCSIKTRLGIHEAGASCADAGLIILEIVAESAKTKKLVAQLGKLPGARVKLVPLGVIA